MTETNDPLLSNVERVVVLTVMAVVAVMTIGLVIFACLALIVMSLWWTPVLACTAFAFWVVYNWMDRNL